MVPLTHLWLPIVLSAVLVFVASSLIHTVLRWHNADYHPLPNEAAVLEAIRKGSPAPGQYIFPYCADYKDREKEEMKRKFEQGPLGLVYLLPGGMPKMGKALGQWFLFNVVVACPKVKTAVRLPVERRVTRAKPDWLNVPPCRRPV